MRSEIRDVRWEKRETRYEKRDTRSERRETRNKACPDDYRGTKIQEVNTIELKTVFKRIK
jgi:hypothetical protein